ncbi:MAG: hypothetical protein ACYSUT_03315 [Planctomycetota bacterium]|jgi:hypothetical protein
MNAKEQMPKLLWVSIISLGIMMLSNLVGGFVQVGYFYIVVGIIDGLLIWGIIKGFRWVFWAATVLVFGGLLYISLVGTTGAIIASAFFDSLLFVPLFICRKYFLATKNKFDLN